MATSYITLLSNTRFAFPSLGGSDPGSMNSILGVTIISALSFSTISLFS
ncbi:MAG TPA: hypothetical protein PK986_05170 [Spirochaetota bacterium]|nr:hypothetical protein [Spirochaetota bacterium]